MELTHIRFAQDLKPLLDVKDEAAYYAGAIYPDSRYITKIDRSLTHGGTSPRDPFAPKLSDFEKGWASHLYYDRTAHPLYGALSPWSMEEAQQGNHVWQFMSAVKIVEDLQSYQAMNGEVDMMLHINFPCFPSNENPQTMQIYSEIQKTLYRQQPTLEDYRLFWKSLNGTEEIIGPVMKFAENLLDDLVAQQKIREIYPSVLRDIVSIS